MVMLARGITVEEGKERGFQIVTRRLMRGRRERVGGCRRWDERWARGRREEGIPDYDASLNLGLKNETM